MQRGGYLANSEGVEVSAKWEGARGFFSGQGLVLLQAKGTGDVFFNAYGAVLELDVKDDMLVDTGYVVAFEDTLQYQVSVLPGLVSAVAPSRSSSAVRGWWCASRVRARCGCRRRTVNPFLSWVYPYRPAEESRASSRGIGAARPRTSSAPPIGVKSAGAGALGLCFSWGKELHDLPQVQCCDGIGCVRED